MMSSRPWILLTMINFYNLVYRYDSIGILLLWMHLHYLQGLFGVVFLTTTHTSGLSVSFSFTYLTNQYLFLHPLLLYLHSQYVTLHDVNEFFFSPQLPESELSNFNLLQIAIVGRPNVGKSSLLNAWSKVGCSSYLCQSEAIQFNFFILLIYIK